MYTRHVYEVNGEGFREELYLGIFDDEDNLVGLKRADMELVEGELVTVDPQEGLYIPRWTGSEWIEGATQEEIDELTKPQPVQPTQTELIATELARTNQMVLELTELILGGM